MAQPGQGTGRSRQDIFDLINDKFKMTREEEVAELRREAKAKVEEQRRKEALVGQIYPGWKYADNKTAQKPRPAPKSKTTRQMQASVETDTEDNSPAPKLGQHALHIPQTTTQQEQAQRSPPAPKPKTQDPPPSLEKREGVYSHAPPSKFAREEVATSTLCMRPPKTVSTRSRRSSSQRSVKHGVAVWYGDEVYIVDDAEMPHTSLPPMKRPHRRTY